MPEVRIQPETTAAVRVVPSFVGAIRELGAEWEVKLESPRNDSIVEQRTTGNSPDLLEIALAIRLIVPWDTVQDVVARQLLAKMQTLTRRWWDQGRQRVEVEIVDERGNVLSRVLAPAGD